MDLSQWPIVQVTAPPQVSDEELRRHMDEFAEACQERRGKAVVVLDLRVCETISVAQRRMMTDRMQANEGSERIVGMAMVFESRLLRGILTAMFWVHRPRYATRVFVNLKDAYEWAEMMAKGQDPDQEKAPQTLPPASRPPVSRVPESELFVKDPGDGNWIVHVDASRSRNVAAEMVGALRAANNDAFLCEKKVSGDLSLWLGWLGPFERRDEAFEARDDLARRGVLLTVSQWFASTG